MAHLHKKMKKGRPYYYIRKIKRVNGKPKVVSQIYLGSPDTMLRRLQEAEARGKPLKVASRQYGALFVCSELERELDTIGIVDGIVERGSRETGPTVGEYFFYSWANRLIAPRSKRALADWYRHTAVGEIRPVDLSALTSQRYWDKWDRVSAEDVERIGRAFFERVWELQPLPAECLLFDTTNYYTFLSSQTESELCQRGKNKAGRHHLRQVGLALLCDRATGLPLYYRAYEGNRHDSKVFRRLVDEMFGIMCGFNRTKQRLTVVFDKGMNSEAGIRAVDDSTRVHFITTYSPYYVEDIAGAYLKRFSPLEIAGNRDRRPEDKIVALRTRREIWGGERTVVVTHNPLTARKKAYTFEQKLASIREELLEYRRRYRKRRAHWRDPDAIVRRYHRLCERLHISTRYYDLEFEGNGDGRDMRFRKNAYEVGKAESLFGRNVIVTDNHDWSTAEIVQLSLDRSGIEQQFRASKSSDHVCLNPMYHWTDGKIRCHLLTCVIALTMLRLLEIRLNAGRSGDNRLSGRTILEEMSNLDSVWLWYKGRRKPEQMLESPTKTQAEVLNSFGWAINDSGVLQKVKP